MLDNLKLSKYKKTRLPVSKNEVIKDKGNSKTPIKILDCSGILINLLCLRGLLKNCLKKFRLDNKLNDLLFIKKNIV